MAAIKQYDKGARIKGKDHEKHSAGVIRLYKGGASIRQIADQTNRSYGSIHRIVSDASQAGLVSMRSRGGATKKKGK